MHHSGAGCRLPREPVRASIRPETLGSNLEDIAEELRLASIDRQAIAPVSSDGDSSGDQTPGAASGPSAEGRAAGEDPIVDHQRALAAEPTISRVHEPARSSEDLA